MYHETRKSEPNSTYKSTAPHAAILNNKALQRLYLKHRNLGHLLPMFRVYAIEESALETATAICKQFNGKNIVIKTTDERQGRGNSFVQSSELSPEVVLKAIIELNINPSHPFLVEEQVYLHHKKDGECRIYRALARFDATGGYHSYIHTKYRIPGNVDSHAAGNNQKIYLPNPTPDESTEPFTEETPISWSQKGKASKKLNLRTELPELYANFHTIQKALYEIDYASFIQLIKQGDLDDCFGTKKSKQEFINMIEQQMLSKRTKGGFTLYREEDQLALFNTLFAVWKMASDYIKDEDRTDSAERAIAKIFEFDKLNRSPSAQNLINKLLATELSLYLGEFDDLLSDLQQFNEEHPFRLHDELMAALGEHQPEPSFILAIERLATLYSQIVENSDTELRDKLVDGLLSCATADDVNTLHKQCQQQLEENSVAKSKASVRHTIRFQFHTTTAKTDSSNERKLPDADEPKPNM